MTRRAGVSPTSKSNTGAVLASWDLNGRAPIGDFAYENLSFKRNRVNSLT